MYGPYDYGPIRPPHPGCPRTKDGRRWNPYGPSPLKEALPTVLALQAAADMQVEMLKRAVTPDEGR